jgi:methanogenic corrinoid protein MtbC1
MNLAQRRQAADLVRHKRDTLAARINEEFFRKHPDWLQRYGERGVKHGFDDACYHIDFLCGAIEAGSIPAFEDYAQWTANVLQSRGIAPKFVAENLRDLRNAVQGLVSELQQAYVEEFIAAGIAVCEHPAQGTEGESADQPGKLAQVSRVLTRALLQGQREAALGVVLETLNSGTPVLDIYVELLQASQREIGRLWESNRITVAQEHMATAITQYVMAQLYPKTPRPQSLKGAMVMTGVEGEYHQVGANIVADVLEADGWDVRFLGANVPHASILRVIEEHDASFAGISVTMLSSMPRLIQLIESIDKTFGAGKVRIIVGGGGFRSRPELWREIGASCYAADARQALTVMRTMI